MKKHFGPHGTAISTVATAPKITSQPCTVPGILLWVNTNHVKLTSLTITQQIYCSMLFRTTHMATKGLCHLDVNNNMFRGTCWNSTSCSSSSLILRTVSKYKMVQDVLFTPDCNAVTQHAPSVLFYNNTAKYNFGPFYVLLRATVCIDFSEKLIHVFFFCNFTPVCCRFLSHWMTELMVWTVWKQIYLCFSQSWHVKSGCILFAVCWLSSIITTQKDWC